MKMRTLWGLMAILLLLTSAVAGAHGGQIVVKVGESADAAKVSTSHNVTVGSLKKAKDKGGEFWVKDAQGTSHPFQLDAKQIADLLDGSMVMVDAKDASGSAAPLRVSLELKPTEPEKAAKSSGW